MKILESIVLIALWLTALGACKRDDAPMADRKVIAETDRAADEVKGARTVVDEVSHDLAKAVEDVGDETEDLARAARELRQANHELEQTRATFAAMRDQVAAQARSTLILMKAQAAMLRGHAHLVAHPLSQRVEEELGKLDGAIDATAEALDRLATATADTWPALKKEVDRRFDEIDHRFDRARDLIL